jgi:hypothetical protein
LQEIRDFLDALDAYPAHFAHDPSLSFEAYFFARAKTRPFPQRTQSYPAKSLPDLHKLVH